MKDKGNLVPPVQEAAKLGILCEAEVLSYK